MPSRSPPPVKAQPLRLHARASVGQAFALVTNACLRHALANEASTLAGDPEGLHQLRVALRRLRSALRAFSAGVGADDLAPLAAEVRALNRVLGPARDVDVLFEEALVPLAAQLPGDRRLRKALRRAEAHRTKLAARVRRELRAGRLRRLPAELEACLHRLGRGGTSGARARRLARPALGYARQVLASAHGRVARGAARFERLGAPERHALRLRVKELRYALDFFGPLFPRRPVAATLEALARLQDCLGALCEATSAPSWLEALGLASRSAPRCLLEGWYAHRARESARRFERLWREARAQPRPWDAPGPSARARGRRADR